MDDNVYSSFSNKISLDDMWQLIMEIGKWDHWDFNIEYSSKDGCFSSGNGINMKNRSKILPQSGMVVFNKDDMGKKMVYLLVFPLSNLFISYYHVKLEDDVEIIVTLSMHGILSPFWYLIYGRAIAKNFPEDIKMLIDETKIRKYKSNLIDSPAI
ncbi:hypothetical protein [Chryseobacterium indologenes]|uniref:hypothetical protein n=1 Tax=Chryseobacterium indologenes TaxID=253 RepID=UPI001BCC8C4B|nr:hypothetical protein [Chryseobacterium indologenes]